MVTVTSEMREFLAKGPNGHLVTINPDGTPHVTLTWAGFDRDELVFATFPDQHKLQNMRREPRVTVSFEATEHSGPKLRPYLVVQGRARLTEGGALAVMDRLAEIYIGPGAQFGWRDAPPGYVGHVTIERLYGVGPWGHDF